MFLEYTIITTSWTDPDKVAKPSNVCSQSCDLLDGVLVNFHEFETCFPKRTLILNLFFLLKIIR